MQKILWLLIAILMSLAVIFIVMAPLHDGTTWNDVVRNRGADTVGFIKFTVCKHHKNDGVADSIDFISSFETIDGIRSSRQESGKIFLKRGKTYAFLFGCSGGGQNNEFPLKISATSTTDSSRLLRSSALTDHHQASGGRYCLQQDDDHSHVWYFSTNVHSPPHFFYGTSNNPELGEIYLFD